MVANKDAKTRKRKKKTKPAIKSPEPEIPETEDVDDMGADDFMAMLGAEGGRDSPDEGDISTGPEGIKVVEKKDDVVIGTTSAKQHKQEIDNLEEKDSDFFKFLKENDPELLNFSGDDSGSEGSESDSEREEEGMEGMEGVAMEEGDVVDEQEEAEEEEKKSVAKPVTKALLRKWEAGLENHSVAVWKQLTKAFHAAVSTARGDDPDSTVKYIIIDPDMVNRVIMLALNKSGPLLAQHLGKNPSAAPKWSKVRLSLKTYLGDLMELLALLTSDDVLCAVMRHAKECLPYYACYSRLMKKFVKSHIGIWGSKGEMARVVAFTCLQQLVTKNAKFLEEVLKKMYTEYTVCSKAMNTKTRDVILLMKNCLVELYKINPSITYSQGFVYIRQLAMTLRSAMVSKKKEVEPVYNWQYVNSLHVWVSVLCDADSCLQPLLFPLIQVLMGAVKLMASNHFHPLHLHIIRMLLYLGSETGVHIPLTHPLLNILEFCATQHKSPSTKPIDLTCVLRVTKGYKKTKAFQDGVFDLTYELMLNYVSQLSGSIAFPETVFPLTVWLKKFIKKCDNPKYKLQVKQILEKVESSSKDISGKRAEVNFSPKDLQKVKEWEQSLPESTLTKYFNSWIIVHRTAQDKIEKVEPEQWEKDNKEDEDSDAEADSEEETEPTQTTPPAAADVKPIKKRKKEPVVEEDEGSEAEDVVEDMVVSEEEEVVEEPVKKKKAVKPKKVKKKKAIAVED